MAEEKKYPFLTSGKYLPHTDDALKGKDLRLAMDNGMEIRLHFTDGEVVEWRLMDGPLHWDKYGCLDAGDGMYFLASVLSGTERPTCITLVIDEKNDLVTMLRSVLGAYPKRPRLVDVTAYFGAIRRPNRELPEKRHGFTRDMVGKKLIWHYSGGFVNMHIYQTERTVRARSVVRTPGMNPVHWVPGQEYYPGIPHDDLLYEEPSLCIRIREGIYLFSFVEDNMNRVDPSAGGNNLVFLADPAGGADAGRTFSMGKNGQVEHGFFRAFCEATDEQVPEEAEPSPYIVNTKEEDLPAYVPQKEAAPPEEPSSRRRYIALPHQGISGSAYHLSFDRLPDHYLRFTGDNRVLFGEAGRPLQEYHCDCFHADDEVWLAMFLKDNCCCTYVLDEHARLATLVVTSEEPYRQGLCNERFYFGAILKDGEPLPFRRHGFTSEVTGRKFCWHYSPYVNITHIYVSEHYMRSSLHNMQPLPEDAGQEAIDDVVSRNERWGRIFFEEPAEFVKINPHLYLTVITEKTRNRIDPMEGGGDMLYLVNLRRKRNYGRGFTIVNGAGFYNLISVACDFDEKEVPFATEKSPYLM